MKKGQIVSALMTCTSGTCARDNCPYWGEVDCADKLMVDAAECIIRLYKDVHRWASKAKENEISMAKAELSSVNGEMHHAEESDSV